MSQHKGGSPMVYALNVANNILKRAFRENVDITPMKLQKLLYFVYKSYLQTTGAKLFEEHFQTWRYGPVVESVYNEFRGYGSNHISSLYKDERGQVWTVDEPNSPEARASIDFVWRNYSQYDGIVLSGYTHMPDTAWYKAFKAGRGFLSDADIQAEEWV